LSWSKAVYNTFQGQPHITLVHCCLGPRLYIIHSRVNHISPWYIIYLVQGYVTYIPGRFPYMLLFWPRAVSHIPGPFACIVLVHHYLVPGLFRIHSRANHILPWYIICLVQGYVTYIPGLFPCMLLVHHCSSLRLVKIHPRANHLSPWYHISPWYIICLVQGYVTFIPGPFLCMFLVHHLFSLGLCHIHPWTILMYASFFGPGLSLISLDHLHACSWYIIILVQGYLEYIPGPTTYYLGISFV